MTGEVVDAARAERIGLVTEVVPHDRLVDRALELAGRSPRFPASTMAGLKEIYTRGCPVIAPALAAEEEIAFAAAPGLRRASATVPRGVRAQQGADRHTE